jgi:hypothetical protein
MNGFLITIGIKQLSWIIVTIIFLLFNMLTKSGTGYLSGLDKIIPFMISSFLYLIFWIIWLIIY